MDESIYKEHLSQPLHTKKKQFKIAVTILTGYNGIFNVTNKNNNFYFTVPFIDDDFNQLTIPAGAYKIKILNIEMKQNIIDKC